MAESVIFVLIAGPILIAIFYYVFGIQNFDPRLITAFIMLLLVPGLYAAFTSGPFVPSARKRHKAMLSLADIQSDDVVYDLGCGDGRLIFEASHYAKKAIGYELSIPLVFFGKLKRLFTRSKGEIRFGNIWQKNYQDADVVFCYLMPKAMKQFYQKIWPHLKPGTRVVSNGFQIHDLKPIEKKEKVYLYKKR